MANVHHTKHRPLTPEEIVQAKDGVVEHMQVVDKLEAELAAEKKKYAERIKPHKVIVKDLMQKITTGHDSGSAWCRVVVDPVTQTVKFFTEKRVFNEDTQRHEYVDTLFDEKTFEEVGESQLTIWQQESEDDAIEDAIERVAQEEWNSLASILEASDFADLYVDDVCRVLAKPFSAEAAEAFLVYAGTPSSKVNVTFSTQGLQASVCALEDFVTGCDEVERGTRLETMGQLLFPKIKDAGVLLDVIINWAAAETAETVDAEDEADESDED